VHNFKPILNFLLFSLFFLFRTYYVLLNHFFYFQMMDTSCVYEGEGSFELLVLVDKGDVAFPSFNQQDFSSRPANTLNFLDDSFWGEARVQNKSGDHCVETGVWIGNFFTVCELHLDLLWEVIELQNLLKHPLTPVHADETLDVRWVVFKVQACADAEFTHLSFCVRQESFPKLVDFVRPLESLNLLIVRTELLTDLSYWGATSLWICSKNSFLFCIACKSSCAFLKLLYLKDKKEEVPYRIAL